MRNIWSIFVQLVTTWNENYQQSYKEETNSIHKFTLIPNFHKHLVLQTVQRMNVDVMLVVLSEELNIAKLAHYQQDVLINNQQPLNLEAYGRASKIIEVQNLGNKEKVRISVDDLSNIIIPRIEEIFEKVSSELKKSGFFNSLNSGIVITGGSSKLFGLREFVSNHLRLSTRIGKPIYTNNLSDIVTNFRYSTVIGILEKAYDNFLIKKENKNSVNFLNNFFQECKNWFYKNF